MTTAPTSNVSDITGRLPDSRTAVVTGAGGAAGIGRVTARVLAENGWHVALVDINADGLATVESELREAGHAGVLAVPANIAAEDSVVEAYRRIDGELPPVVGLVNLAGIACPTPLAECSLDEFERVMAVNVTGSFLMLKAAAERMIPQGVGRIVNTSSITAFDGGGTFSKGVYATASRFVCPASRSSPSTAARPSALMSTRATCQPFSASTRAVTRPIPAGPPAPVTTAVRESGSRGGAEADVIIAPSLVRVGREGCRGAPGRRPGCGR